MTILFNRDKQFRRLSLLPSENASTQSAIFVTVKFDSPSPYFPDSSAASVYIFLCYNATLPWDAVWGWIA